MMIDVEPLIPMLDTAKKAKAELAASDDAWHALTREEQRVQLDDFLARDKVSQTTYDDACRQIIAALHDAVIDYGN